MLPYQGRITPHITANKKAGQGTIAAFCCPSVFALCMPGMDVNV
jgi:hypothetical protein